MQAQLQQLFAAGCFKKTADHFPLLRVAQQFTIRSASISSCRSSSCGGCGNRDDFLSAPEGATLPGQYPACSRKLREAPPAAHSAGRHRRCNVPCRNGSERRAKWPQLENGRCSSSRPSASPSKFWKTTALSAPCLLLAARSYRRARNRRVDSLPCMKETPAFQNGLSSV